MENMRGRHTFFNCAIDQGAGAPPHSGHPPDVLLGWSETRSDPVGNAAGWGPSDATARLSRRLAPWQACFPTRQFPHVLGEAQAGAGLVERQEFGCIVLVRERDRRCRDPRGQDRPEAALPEMSARQEPAEVDEPPEVGDLDAGGDAGLLSDLAQRRGAQRGVERLDAAGDALPIAPARGRAAQEQAAPTVLDGHGEPGLDDEPRFLGGPLAEKSGRFVDRQRVPSDGTSRDW